MGPAALVTSTQEVEYLTSSHFPQGGAIHIRKVSRNAFQTFYRLLQQYPIFKERNTVQFIDDDRSLYYIIIKFPYNARSDWLKQRALSENRALVDDGELASKFLLRNFDKFDPN